MKYISIKKTEYLFRLSSCLFIEPEKLEELIISKLIEIDLLFDTPECCGYSIKDILNDETVNLEGYTIGGISILLFCKSSDLIQELLSHILIWGKANECPLCGCEVYVEGEYTSPDWDDGHTDTLYEKRYCSNPDCAFEEIEEDSPEWRF